MPSPHRPLPAPGPTRGRTSGLLALALVTLSAAAARATVIAETPLVDLTADADAIVRGVVDRVGTRLVVADGALETRTIAHVRVTERFKGVTPPVVRVVEVGGTAGDVQIQLVGAATLAAGEDVLLFLRRDANDPRAFRTYDLALGKFSILRHKVTHEEFAVRDLSALSFARWTDGRMALRSPDREPALPWLKISQLIRDVLAAVAPEARP